MQDLHAQLTGTGIAALNQAAAIAGLGGIGKTQTAVEYAYRCFQDERIYEWVFWIKADTELNLATDFAAIARSLDLGDGTIDELAARSLQWLETHDRWLLIFDNADEPKWLKPFFPKNASGKILLTSRSPRFTVLGIVQPITVTAWDEVDSIAFLCERTGQELDQLNADESKAVKALAQELGGLPLAVEQAAAYIEQKQVRFTVYLANYRRRRLELLERQSPEMGDDRKSVATTWQLNFEEVERRSPAAVQVLQLSAFLAADDIPEVLLWQNAEPLGLTGCEDELTLKECLAALADFSLIRRERETESYGVHLMVQEVVRHGLTVAVRQEWMRRAIAGLNAGFPDPKFENWQICEWLVPHVQAIAEQLETYPVNALELVRLLNVAGYYLSDQGRYGEAEILLVLSLRVSEQQLGSNHSSTATSLSNLAQVYRLQKRYCEAEPLFVRSLQIDEQQSGSDRSSVAISYGNLAGINEAMGRYDEAEPLRKISLKIHKQHLGVSHPYVATGLNNLAFLYDLQERYAEAEPLYVQSLQSREQQLGADHPDTAISLNNLAGLYCFQERYTEAEPLYVRSLSILKKVLPPNHPSLAIVRGNLVELRSKLE